MALLDLRDFSGGLNLRDSSELLALNETPDALNMGLTTRGAARVRAGAVQAATLPATGASRLYYSRRQDKWFLACGTALYVRPGDLSGSWTSHITGMYANYIGICDFNNLVVITSTDNAAGMKIWTSDGTTATLRTSAAGGTSAAVYKNRVWVTGNKSPPTESRLWFSALGDATTWNTGTDFVDIREKDSEPLLALGPGAFGGLLVFKQTSAYRITDPTTGAYQTIDWSSGCIGPHASCFLRGLVYTWGLNGIYAWDGNGRGVSIGDKLRPRFTIPTGAFADGIIASALDDRIFFAFPYGAGTVRNNRIAELRPADAARTDVLPASAWVMEHALADTAADQIGGMTVKAVGTFQQFVEPQLYLALADTPVLYSITGTPGADNSVPYSAYYKTPPLTVGRLSRPERIRIYGRAEAGATSTKEFRTYRDWQSTVDETFDLTSRFESADGEEVADLFSLDHAEAHQLEFRSYGGTGAAELDRIVVDLTELER